MISKIALIAALGAAGTLARYGLSGWVQRASGSGFPWGTLAVNVAGCFLFGLVWAVSEGRLSIRPEYRTIALVGFMGAFTTFSTFAFETVQLLREDQWGAAFLSVTAQNLSGILFLFLGLAIGKAL
ncbi:MAG TPA: fluoride efflux transporter CrcB [Nitrospiria bacterium]|nr:fluoride efflux transporter CrcB [Nitrospiria bacterium]